MPWHRGRPASAERSDDGEKAYARALDKLAGRDYSSQELYERLCRQFTGPAAAEAIARLLELGLLDDEKYAAARAQSLQRAGKSRRAAAFALRGRGLNDGQIAQALEAAYTAGEEEPDPELAAATALAAGRYRAKLAAGRRDLVAAALTRRGFPYPVVRAALEAAQQQLEG